ncbi:MAG TPA: DegQ family serine endoprotease [Acetobacteraceae bacterium]
MRRHTLRALALASVFALPAVIPAFVPQPAQARAAGDSFADLAAQLLPAVVNISSTQKADVRADRDAGPEVPQFPPGSPFEQFFRDFLDRNRPGQQGRRGGPQQGPQGPRGDGEGAVSLGSGFIIDAAGYIVTNNHVIDGADKISVTLQDNTTLKATLVGKDDKADLALLKVESDKPLTAVPFGDSDTGRVGDWVLAIGNPFGLGGSVTAGIVSARGRDIRQGPYDDFIQTDAAINRGNSGGPLFNMNGEVIGINTAIYSPSGGSVGIGFSVPSNMAKAVVQQLRDYGRARRGWLGVNIQQVTPDIAESLGLKGNSGALVARVTDDGPAAKANIHNGDVILRFNSQDVKEMKTLPRIVAETVIGKDVPVVVWRDGKEVTVQAQVGELPDSPQQVASNTPAPPRPPANRNTEVSGLGARLSSITDEMRDKFKIAADQKGVVVTDVSPDGAAAGRGLKPGDVIVEVQQEPVSSPADVQERMDRYRKQNRKTVLMLVQSSEGLRWVPVPLTTDSIRKQG